MYVTSSHRASRLLDLTYWRSSRYNESCVCALMLQSQQRARVIMLSLEHAASGTNLTEATHIVLMDPVSGTPAKAVSVERQAIGRAHRMGQNKQVCAVGLLLGPIACKA